MPKWTKTTFPGVRYREHSTRKHGVKKDQYFTIRYKVKGKDHEEGLGWASEGWTASKAFNRLAELKKNQKIGEGPQTLSEKRDLEQERRDQAEQARIEAEKKNIIFDDFMVGSYLPQCKADKKPKTYAIEEMLYRRYLAKTIGCLSFGKVARIAYLTERVKNMLRQRKQGRPDDNEMIFPKRSGTAGTMAQASGSFADAVKDLGLNEGITNRKQKVTFHTLRHTYATHLYENTHDLYLTQRSLGHATGVMDTRYAKMSEDRLRDGARRRLRRHLHRTA